MADLQNVEGLREIQSALQQLPDRIARNVLRGAVGAGASVIRQEAKLRAPVAEGPQRPDAPPPGTLKRAVYSKQIRELSSVAKQVYFVGVRRGRKYRKVGKQYMDAFYWWFVENGTSKMAARPFLRPAFEAKKNEAVEAIRLYLLKRIPDEVAKLVHR